MSNLAGSKSIIRAIRNDSKLFLGLFLFAFFILIGISADILASPDSFFVGFGPETASKSSPIYMAPGHKEIFPDGVSKLHLLGTDQLGRDVLARMIHGTRLALLVGFSSTAISFLIALFLGSLSGYFGNNRIHFNIIDAVGMPVVLICGSVLLSYNAFFINGNGQNVINFGRIGSLLLIITLVVLGLRKTSSLFLERKWPLPIDGIIVKLLEVFRAIPALFLIIALFSLIEYPSIWTVIFIIGVLRWGTMTRLLRAEIIQIKTENYIVSARLMGLPDWRILVYHIWPNAISPMIVSACFAIGTAVLIEATLSFLGIGVPVNVVSWGNMLSTSRSYIGAWWLALFPGLAIFLLILSVTIIGDRLRKHLKKE